MGQPVNPTVKVDAEAVMQRAVDILYTHNDPNTGLPKFEAVRAAGVLVNAAKELRLGKSKSRIYTNITAPADHSDEIVGVSWHGVPDATGYDIEVRPNRAPRVVPVFTQPDETLPPHAEMSESEND